MKRVSTKIRKKAQKIKLLLLDVDGVLTDGSILLDKQGLELKRFDVRDGHGIRLLMRAGLQVGFLTGRSSQAVSERAKELGVRMVYQNAHHKVETYRKIKKRTGFEDHEIAYVGDDIVDLPVLRKVGLSLAVKGCWDGLKDIVDYVTEIEGGRGAVREITDLLLRLQGRWQEITARYYRS